MIAPCRNWWRLQTASCSFSAPFSLRQSCVCFAASLKPAHSPFCPVVFYCPQAAAAHSSASLLIASSSRAYSALWLCWNCRGWSWETAGTWRRPWIWHGVPPLSFRFSSGTFAPSSICFQSSRTITYPCCTWTEASSVACWISAVCASGGPGCAEAACKSCCWFAFPRRTQSAVEACPVTNAAIVEST